MKLLAFIPALVFLLACGTPTTTTISPATCSQPTVIDPPVTMQVDSIPTYDSCGGSVATEFTGTISINADGGNGWKRFTSTDAVGHVWTGWIKQ